jgi:hypothetical protein
MKFHRSRFRVTQARSGPGGEHHLFGAFYLYSCFSKWGFVVKYGALNVFPCRFEELDFLASATHEDSKTIAHMFQSLL